VSGRQHALVMRHLLGLHEMRHGDFGERRYQDVGTSRRWRNPGSSQPSNARRRGATQEPAPAYIRRLPPPKPIRDAEHVRRKKAEASVEVSAAVSVADVGAPSDSNIRRAGS
jgi:hypothetical protein